MKKNKNRDISGIKNEFYTPSLIEIASVLLNSLKRLFFFFNAENEVFLDTVCITFFFFISDAEFRQKFDQDRFQRPTFLICVHFSQIPNIILQIILPTSFHIPSLLGEKLKSHYAFYHDSFELIFLSIRLCLYNYCIKLKYMLTVIKNDIFFQK